MKRKKNISYSTIVVGIMVGTGAMCYNTPLPNIFLPALIEKSTKCMERATDFKSSNSLVILAFKEEINFRARWSPSFVWCADQRFASLRTRSNAVQGLRC